MTRARRRPVRALGPALFFATAAACGPGKDRIDLTAQSGTATATILVDGRRADCVNDEKLEGVGSLEIDNLLSAGSCPSEEVVAFARNNAVAVKDTRESWSDRSGDVVPVSMSPPTSLPVAVFVMFGDPDDVGSRAEDEINQATELYDREQCGIVFTKELVKDVRQGNFQFPLLTAHCDGHVAEFDNIDPAVKDAKGVKVFYHLGDSGSQGETCSDGNSAVILIASSYRNPATLAHELGHALTLEHANCIAGMPENNVMMSPASFPASMTIGQCFRTSFNGDSVLNKLQFRLGPTRSCADLRVSADCPTIALQK